MSKEYYGKPRHACREYVARHQDIPLEWISRKAFDELYDNRQFTDGPFIDSFGDGYGEPYNPNRQAFGVTRDGRCVFCELSKDAQPAERVKRDGK